MKILIHGDNQVKSRASLQNLKQQCKSQGMTDVVTISPKDFDLTVLKQALSSQSLFGTNRLLVLENIFGIRSKTLLRAGLNLIEEASEQATSILVWEPKTLTASQLKKLPSYKVETHKSSPIVFRLLENLEPGKKINFKDLETIFLQESAEFFLYMLIRQIRLLLLAKNDLVTGAPWQVNKLKQQAKAFTAVQIADFIEKIVDLDFRHKTGQLAHSLDFEIEIFLLKLQANG